MSTHLQPRRRLRGVLPAAATIAGLVLAGLMALSLVAPPAALATEPDRIEAVPVIGGVPVGPNLQPVGPDRAPDAPTDPADAVPDPADAVPDAADAVPEPVVADPDAADADPSPGAMDTGAPRDAGQRISLVDGGARLAPFAGLSTWIDLYDTDIDAAEQAAIAAASGVQTIFAQTARHSSATDIEDADRLGALLEAAHDRGLDVVTWYIADHLDVEVDLRRSQAAIAFRSPRGDAPDAFGLDIETELQTDVAERTRQLLELSRRLRTAVGPDYPMAAIVLPPLQLDLRPDWWPAFPYAELTDSYDVFVPMSYSSFRGTDAATTYAWNLANITELRARSGDPALKVHLAGGIADDLPELGAFVQAAGDGHVLGAGLYDLHTTAADAWPALQALRAGD